jgi:hypothetical protein
MKPVFILHSGFVTTDSSKLLRSTIEDKGIRKMVIQPSSLGEDPDSYYDSEVTGIFNQWRKDEDLIRNFEFRETLLKVALRAFDDQSFGRWIELQHAQGGVGYLHRRFIKEMVGRIFSEQAKTMDNYQYYRLLSREPFSTKFPDTNSVSVFSTDYLDTFIKSGQGSFLPDVLTEWTKDMDGVADLICTLNVIFGRRVAGIVKISST